MSIVEPGLSRLAFCWRLERKDGAGLALTSHDRALSIGGIRYEPAPGMTPSAIHAELGIEARSSEVGGALSSAAISEGDIAAGRWDGALLHLFAVDWETPETEAIDLLSGELGQVESSDGEYSADLLGVAAKLERPVCPLTSPECRAELGDPHCRVDMAGRRLRAMIVSATANVVTLDRAIDSRFTFGRIRFLGGVLNGQSQRILTAQGNQLSLRSMPELEVAAGIWVEVSEGCDKRLQTCADRFANAVNFRGEPHLPGNDLLTRYPGA